MRNIVSCIILLGHNPGRTFWPSMVASSAGVWGCESMFSGRKEISVECNNSVKRKCQLTRLWPKRIMHKTMLRIFYSLRFTEEMMKKSK